MTLVALFAMTAGAWAETETITTAAELWQGAKTFTGTNVTVSVQNGGDSDGSYVSVTNTMDISVTGDNIITGLVLTIGLNSGQAGYMLAQPGNCTVSGSGSHSTFVTVTDINASSVTMVMDDYAVYVEKVEVTYANPYTPTPVAGQTNQWKFLMPAGDVELQVEYYPGMLVKPTNLVGGTMEIEGLTGPFTKLEVPDAWENDNTLLSAAHLPGLKEMTDAEAEKWTDAPNGYVILIYGFDGTKAKTATYLLGKFSNASPEDVKLSQLKTASAEAEIYYSSEAQMPAGFETDGKNIYVADKTEFQVKATPADGFRLVSLMFGEQDITDQVDADGIATLTMPEGNADITLTATFSDMYTVTLNAEGLTDEEAANWKAATGDKAPAAFPLENVKYGTEVKVTYGGTKKVIGVKAAKKVEPKKLTVGNVTFYYDEGQTFTEAKQKYADLNSGWILNGPYISVQGAISIVLFKGESPVEGTSKIEPNAEYSWINFS